MTDRELLELAAKAAGLKLSEPHYTDALMVEKVTGQGVGHCTAVVSWNPLTNDGDALRLAVKLNIEWVGMDDTRSANAGVWRLPEYRGDIWNCVTPYNGDKYAAVRRAIVRAAAQIGAKQ